MITPKRVQLSRKKGWKLPPNTVNCSRPGKWGNPFRIGGYFMVGDPDPKYRFQMSWCESHAPDPRFTRIADATMAVEFYRRLLDRGHYKPEELQELRGKDLACWCALSQCCHTDLLLELANK